VRTAAEMALFWPESISREPRNGVLASFSIVLRRPTLWVRFRKVNELLGLGVREIYVYYADGVGNRSSRSRLPKRTGRNINTVAKLAEMAAGSMGIRPKRPEPKGT